ncbi:MAG: hypothetical protein ACOC6D_08255, partial [Atribacterota bacterium]
TSSKHEFNFEYPRDWYLEDNPEFNSIFLSSKQEEPPMGGVSLGARIEIFVSENDQDLKLEDWVEWHKSQSGQEKEVLETKQITVGDKQAIKETVAAPEGVVTQGNPATVYCATNGEIIQMNYTGREPDYSENIEVFQHLLNSFNFK